MKIETKVTIVLDAREAQALLRILGIPRDTKESEGLNPIDCQITSGLWDILNEQIKQVEN